MNINNPTTFGTPALVYSTSNSSGTGGALRADDTVAIFSSTVPTTIAFSASAATGDNAFASREDHVHGMPAHPVLVSNIVAGTRSAAAGAGDQTIEGFGFAPTTVHMMIQKGTATVNGSIGWGDDDADEYSWAVVDTASNFTANSSYLATMNPGIGSDAMYGVFKEYTSDGIIITWAAPGSGIDIAFAILGMR